MLSYDSATMRNKVIYNFHTGELMGFGYDAMDMGLIKNGVLQLRVLLQKRAPMTTINHPRRHQSLSWQNISCSSTLLVGRP
jgi:hypothetical protein